MLLDFATIVRDRELIINGVVHVGAHLAEEAPIYKELGINKVVWFEANPYVLPKLVPIVESYGQELISACITDVEGDKVQFNVSNYDGMSSSVFEFGTHPTFSPDTIYERTVELATTTLDGWAFRFPGCNALVMDVQGAELKALEGAQQSLKQFDLVMSEVNQEEVYVGCAKIWELDAMLEGYGFTRVETHWVPNQGWGDALWCRS